MLINQAMRNANVHSAARVLGGTVVVSEKFISSCLTLFDEAMRQKAQKVAPHTTGRIKTLVGPETWAKLCVFSVCHMSQEVKNNPVFVITEEDLKQASVLTESSAPSKKEKREAERRKKATGWFSLLHHHSFFSNPQSRRTNIFSPSVCVCVCLSEGSGSVKSGGGGNAREIRIRKTKKKGRRDEDSDEETGATQQSKTTECLR